MIKKQQTHLKVLFILLFISIFVGCKTLIKDRYFIVDRIEYYSSTKSVYRTKVLVARGQGSPRGLNNGKESYKYYLFIDDNNKYQIGDTLYLDIIKSKL